MNPKHGTNCRPNRGMVPRRKTGKQLPCGILVGSIPYCWEPNCYLNYKCPVFQGSHINPPRDYIPITCEDRGKGSRQPRTNGEDFSWWFSVCLKKHNYSPHHEK